MLAVHLNVTFLVIINKRLEHREKKKMTQIKRNNVEGFKNLITWQEPQVRMSHYILVIRVPLVSEMPPGLHAVCTVVMFISLMTV